MDEEMLIGNQRKVKKTSSAGRDAPRLGEGYIGKVFYFTCCFYVLQPIIQ